ncbi:LacI family transcriptional regulator [Lachnospiraceae bacterium]|nr:LacI family transcriptional regulator [Lachnospiraceae bacterium]
MEFMEEQKFKLPPYAMVNLESGSYQLIRYLLDMGHRDIYFLSSNREMIPTATRINGYKRAFEEYGLQVDDGKFVDCNAVAFEQAFQMTEELVQSGKNIDAIVAMNDMMALGALRVLMNKGVRIPEEISLAGYDDVIFSNVAAIPLTTVRQDIFRLSRAAVDMLVRMIGGGQGNEHFMIEPDLVVRKSTGRKQTKTP